VKRIASGGSGPKAKGAIPQLIALLRSGDPKLEWSAEDAVGAMGAAAAPAVPALTDMLRAKPYDWAVMSTLGEIGAPAKPAEPLLISIFHDHETDRFSREYGVRAGTGDSPV
jgi:HEAT repeat protein